MVFLPQGQTVQGIFGQVAAAVTADGQHYQGHLDLVGFVTYRKLAHAD